jgi:uncharacterized 2Fe-2S/4Fe-4S cluster protein (DUF4445 family)
MNRSLGIAFDVGTTNVRAALVRLDTGEMLAQTMLPNPQSKYGKNVIDRIAVSGKRRENLSKLHHEIMAAVNDIARNLSESAGGNPRDTMIFAFVANPTMGHLLAGEDPSCLGVAPHTPAFTESRTGQLSALSPDPVSDAIYYLAPSIGGHIGSDLLAGIISTGMAGSHIPVPDICRPYVRADVHVTQPDAAHSDTLRTNTIQQDASQNETSQSTATQADAAHASEVCASTMQSDAATKMDRSSKNQLLIDMGTNGEIVLRKGNRYAACSTAAGPAFESGGRHGSDVIATLSSLLGYGAVDREGRIVNEKIVSAAGMTQNQIRQIQSAKAAIRAGIETLTEKFSVTPDDFDDIFITGNFGNGIDPNAAMSLGLLPRVKANIVSFVPDAALNGAILLMLSKQAGEAAERFAPSISRLELANETRFQNEYVKQMDF